MQGGAEYRMKTFPVLAVLFPALAFGGHVRQQDLNSDLSVVVRANLVAGASVSYGLGHSDAVGTSLGLLYHGHDTGVASVEALVATPSTVKISSTSTDDAVGQSGATAVVVSGVSDTNAAIAETLAMDGQTEVTTTNTFKVVTKIQVVAAGAGGSNVGEIWAGNGTVTAGVPATKYNSVEIATNISSAAIVAVPAGCKYIVRQFTIYSGDTTKVLNFEIMQYSAATGLWYEVIDIHGKQDEIIADVYAYPTLQPGDVLMLRAKVDVSTAKVTCSLGGFLIEIQ